MLALINAPVSGKPQEEIRSFHSLSPIRDGYDVSVRDLMPFIFDRWPQLLWPPSEIPPCRVTAANAL